MDAHTLPPLRISHPAPQRDRVGLTALLFGIAAPPIAWSAQLLLSVALSGYACYPRNRFLAAPLWGGLWSILLAISVAGIVLAIIAGLVAWRSWRRTRDERPGSAHHLLDRGDGRTRFMAMCGILASTLFLVALVFGIAALYLVPLCGR
jgi:membrane protein implicated in regulation of membrane protease activity